MTAKIWAGSFLAELKLGLGGHLKVSQASLQPQAGLVLLSGSSGVHLGPQITQPQQHLPALLLPDPGRTELWAAVPLLSPLSLQISKASPAAPALSGDALPVLHHHGIPPAFLVGGTMAPALQSHQTISGAS